jgi:hypothetical protein
MLDHSKLVEGAGIVVSELTSYKALNERFGL